MVSPVVVVPVRGDGPGVAENLRATAGAARAAGLDTIVVDNGMTGALRSAVAGTPGVEVLLCATAGSYPARNAGVAAAVSRGASAVVFTDADCRPGPGWPAHLLDVLTAADIVTTVAPPRPESQLGRGANLDYRRRLRQWAGGPIACGAAIGTMDTRGCAVRAEAFAGRAFDTRLRFAGDAVFGRAAVAAGLRVVGCHHEIVSHDPPRRWTGELVKYARIAAALVADLGAFGRRDVLRFLPEHAHLLLPAPVSAERYQRRLHLAARALTADGPPEQAAELYVAVRELGWYLGWAYGQRRRSPADAADAATDAAAVSGLDDVPIRLWRGEPR